MGSQKVVDGVARDTKKVRVVGAAIDIGQAVSGQTAYPRRGLMRCLRKCVLIVARVEGAAETELLEL